MESAFLLEKKLITMTFNTTKETAYLLISDSEKLDLTEENISSDVIVKRFKLFMANDLNYTTNYYKKLPKDTVEGYSLYYWELEQKLFLSYPSGYLLIYNTITGNLDHHFQARGRNPYTIRNLVGSPILKSFFFSAESMRNIYHCSYDSVVKGQPQYTKLVLPKNVTVNELTCHPNEKFIFIACSDGIIRVFDYSTNKEITTGLVDLPLDNNGNPLKNQNELIKQNNISSITTLEINNYGNYLLSGCDVGYMYLWDALVAIKGKRNLLSKARFSSTGLICAKFLKMKQFENLDRIICLTKEGKVYICSVVIKNKTHSFNKLYENSIFKPILYSLERYNIITSSFINCSVISNLISIRWPNIRMGRIKNSDEKSEDYLLFLNYTSKFFFIYDNIQPKINFPHATQLSFPYYTELIPKSENSSINSNIVFEQYVYVCDNYFLYQYSINSGNTRKLLNYVKEFNLKSSLPLKFEVRPRRKRINPESPMQIIILVQNDNQSKSILYIELSGYITNNVVTYTEKIDNVIDFVVLGNEEDDLEYCLFLYKNKQIAILYDVKNKTQENKSIEGSILRMYNTPFSGCFSVIYRNVLNQLKFSENIALSVFHKDKFGNNRSSIVMNNNTNSNIEEFDNNINAYNNANIGEGDIKENDYFNNYNEDFNMNVYTNIRPSDVKIKKSEADFKSNNISQSNNIIDINTRLSQDIGENIKYVKEQAQLGKTVSHTLNIFSFKNENKTSLCLDFSEREIDIAWMSFSDKLCNNKAFGNNNSNNNNNNNFIENNSKNIYTNISSEININNSNNNHNENKTNESIQYEFWCAISMIEKILICNHELTPIFQIKISLLENPNIISSLFWVGKTLIYTRGNDIYYYYPSDSTQSKIFTNDQTHTIVSGVLADRFILTNKIWGSKELITISVTSPAISPLEPILIGYLDIGINIDYSLVKEAVLNLFTNQVSETLINKFLSKNLNEIAAMFTHDNKSSYLDINKKLQLSNYLLDFEHNLDILFPNLDLKNKLQVEELIWKIKYEQNYEELKQAILTQYSVLVEYGFFRNAMQLLELVSDYPRAINLLLLCGSNSDFISYLKIFAYNNKLSYSELMLIVNAFVLEYSQIDNKNKIIDICDYNTTYEINSKINYGMSELKATELMNETHKKIKESKMMSNNPLSQNFGNNNSNNNNINKNTESSFNNDEVKGISYSKVFDLYKGEPLLFDFLTETNSNSNNYNNINNNVSVNISYGFNNGINGDNSNSNLKGSSITNNYNVIKNLNKNNSYVSNIGKKILTFGESAFTQYVEIFNSESRNYELVSISNLQLSKIEQFYGYFNIVDEKKVQRRNMDFYDNSVPLSELKNDTTKDTSNINDEDPSISQDIEEINENMYLSFYLRCDKGNGTIIEDISPNSNDGQISIALPEANINTNMDETNKEDKFIWSPPLEENDPLELDDKWGRKSAASHSLIFNTANKTSLKIKNNPSFKYFHKHFTIELWIKPFSLKSTIFKKESFVVSLYSGDIEIDYNNNKVALNKIKDVSIYCDQWQHIAVSYRKSKGVVNVYIMGELAYEGSVILIDGTSNFGDFIFGDGNMSSLITELRGWNQSIPVGILKENMKCPLPILSVNKRKVNKVKIKNIENKKGQGFKNFNFGGNIMKSVNVEKKFNNDSINYPNLN